MKKKILLFILVLASVLRSYELASYPVGLNADEAALGYNSYSLLLTGKDEHGHPWPINLESFGDFKPALYAYILLPFIKVFGLTEFAVRLPSALFGILAVYGIYLLTKELFRNLEFNNYLVIGPLKLRIEEIASLFLAISPWHLHFSRGAWEVNLATTFIIFGVYFFLKWQNSKKVLWLAACVLGFVLSMYSYQSARILAPLFGIGLILSTYKQALLLWRQLFIGLILLLLLLLPLGISIVSTDAASRFAGVGFLADEGPLNRVNELRGQYPYPNYLAKILYNRPVIYTLQFVNNYLSHFNGDFLFISGDIIERNRVPETGLLYLVDAVFILLGVIFLIRKSEFITHKSTIWLWLLLAPVPAALTFQVPHALRAQNLVIPLTILTACGVYQLLLFIGSFKYWKMIGYLSLVIGYSWCLSRYLHQYYVHYPDVYPSAWQAGFKDLVTYVTENSNKYSKVIITDKYDQPYILFLFYSKYSPVLFQQDHQLTFRDKFNFSTVRNYSNYTFTSTKWEDVKDIHSSLIVTAPEDVPTEGVNLIKVITYPNGTPAFKIIAN